MLIRILYIAVVLPFFFRFMYRYDIRIAYEMEGPRPVQMAFDFAGEVMKIIFSPGQRSLMIDNIFLEGGVQDWHVKLYKCICIYKEP